MFAFINEIYCAPNLRVDARVINKVNAKREPPKSTPSIFLRVLKQSVALFAERKAYGATTSYGWLP